MAKTMKTGEPAAVPAVALKGLTKRFGALVANHDVSFSVQPGEVCTVLGENGAGKTTLVRMLAGELDPDEGVIELAGKPVQLSSPRVAIEQGVGMLHQHFALVDTMTATENLLLGSRGTRPLPLAAASARLKELAREYSLDVDPDQLVRTMAVGARQRLEVLRLLYRDVKVVILDEPTAVLAPSEVQQLFRIVRRLTAEGRAVIFISHKLDEVMEISDRIVVLRDGELIGTVPIAEATPQVLTRLMVGRDVAIERRRSNGDVQGGPVLVVNGVSCVDERGLARLRDVSFRVHAGEILGVAGIDGNGQRELAEVIAGLHDRSAGDVLFDGEPTKEMLVRRPDLFGFIPEERRATGVILDFSVEENLILKSFAQPRYGRWGFLRRRRVRQDARAMLSEFAMRRVRPEALVETLSGGNQQRVLVARELARSPRLVVAAHPTRGLDVGAIERVHELLIGARDQGAAILYISGELTELLALSDRILVMHEGRNMGIVGPETSVETIGRLMLGGSLDVDETNGLDRKETHDDAV